MGYGKSNRVLTRMSNILDEIMLSENPNWTFETTQEAVTFSYAIRNALNYARKNKIDPYYKLSLSVKQKLNRVSIKKHKGWSIISRSDSSVKICPANSLTTLILTFQPESFSQFKLPNLIIQSEEEDLFQDFLDTKNLVLVQRNPIILKNGNQNNIS